MAAKKKELLEQELIGAEDNGTVENGAAENGVTENAAAENEAAENEAAESEGVPNSADGPAAVAEEPGPGLDEILADMESGVSADTYSDELSGEMAAAENTGVKISGTGEPGSHMPDAAATEEPSPARKRAAGKKKETQNKEAAERPTVTDGTVEAAERMDVDREEAETPSLEITNEGTGDSGDIADAAPSPVPRRASRGRSGAEAPVLTIEARSEVETAEEREDVIWHEIHNAYRTRRILMGQLCGIEQTDTGKTIAIADYKGFRIVIPMKEMMINVGRSPSGQDYTDLMLRQNKILNNMLGAHIDFVIKGIDSKTRSVVASRREAMLKKRQIFYLETDPAGMYRIYEGRIVQARIIAVAEKVIRVEIFGVECSIMARDLAWDWVGDAHERFSVGDETLVRILGVRRDSLEEIGVKADIKSVTQNNNNENLKKCRIQSKYAGKVTDVRKGVVYVRLSNGVNAVAHSCYDQRMPGKKDDVSFAVTRIDEERGVAVGIITRIIRQNL